MRRFVYKGMPDDIKNYLSELSYQTEDIYNSEGEAIGFSIVGTTIKVGYKSVAGRWIEGATVSMLNDPVVLEEEPQKVQQSLMIYPKLYRRFRKISHK